MKKLNLDAEKGIRQDTILKLDPPKTSEQKKYLLTHQDDKA